MVVSRRRAPVEEERDCDIGQPVDLVPQALQLEVAELGALAAEELTTLLERKHTPQPRK